MIGQEQLGFKHDQFLPASDALWYPWQTPMANIAYSFANRCISFPRKGLRWLYDASPVGMQNVLLRLRPLQGVGLALSFAIAFSLPLFLFYRGVNYFWSDRGAHEVVLERFPKASRFGYQGAYGKVFYDQTLTPSTERAWMFSGWFKLSQLPAVGQRVLLSVSFDPDSRAHEGFGIGVLRDPSGFRPVVYWRASNGKGGWYQFAKFPIREQSWFLLSVSFRDGKLLGLHGVSDIDDKSRGVELLGGYELEEPIVPDSKTDLLFGAYGENHFRGFVGPVSIFSGNDIGKDINAIVKQLAKNPEQLPDSVSTESVVLRGYLGEELMSAAPLRSEIVKPGRARKKGAGDERGEENR